MVAARAGSYRLIGRRCILHRFFRRFICFAHRPCDSRHDLVFSYLTFVCTWSQPYVGLRFI